MALVAVVQWSSNDGLAKVICDELQGLGWETTRFLSSEPVPPEARIVFSYAPYGRFSQILHGLAQQPPGRRPQLVHWNTEGLPDLRIPWPVVATIGAVRSWIGRLADSPYHLVRVMAVKPPLPLIRNRMLRFRYVGDYRFAYARGLLTFLADSSAVYANLFSRNRLPTVAAPWGATGRWYEDMQLERDIDVLWIGVRGSVRRSRWLDRVRDELAAHKVSMHVVDNQENPFVFGHERTRLLNRAKITLNVTRTWYDDNFSRLALALPNRSLVVSETLLPHCPDYVAGKHYVAVPPAELGRAILHYLNHPAERTRIVEEGYRLSTQVVTLKRTIERIMTAVGEPCLPSAGNGPQQGG